MMFDEELNNNEIDNDNENNKTVTINKNRKNSFNEMRSRRFVSHIPFPINIEKSIKNENLTSQGEDKYLLGNLEKQKTKIEVFMKIANNVTKDYSKRNEIIGPLVREHDAKFHFLYFKCIEFSIAWLSILSMGSGLYYHQFTNYPDVYDKKYVEIAANISIGVVSFTTILILILIYFRYQQILRIKLSTDEICDKENLYTSGLAKYLVIELIVFAIHPNYLFKGYSVTFQYQYIIDFNSPLIYAPYPINDLILLFLLLRIFTIHRFFICLSRYFGARASRVTQMVGLKLTRSFPLKCLMQKRAFLVLAFVAGMFVIILSCMLRIVEGPFYFIDLNSNNIDFRLFQNCIWCVLITMTTVGYGDYYPITYLGRVFMIIAAIVGNTLISLIIVTMQNFFEFTENESKAYELQSSINMKQKIEKSASKLFLSNFHYIQAKRRYVNSVNVGFYSKDHMLKIRRDLENALYVRIKAKKNFKNQIHKYNNLFETQNEADHLKERMEVIRGNIHKFGDNYDELQIKIKMIDELILSVEKRAIDLKIIENSPINIKSGKNK